MHNTPVQCGGYEGPARRRAPLRAVAALALVAGLCCTGCAQNRAPSARFVQQAERLHAGALAATITPDDDLNAYVQEIGRRLGITRERVRQVEAKAIRKLQHPVRARKLEGFLPGGLVR